MREWEVPRVDLLDIERTAHVESIEAADHLADVGEAVCTEMFGPGAQEWRKLLLQAVRDYRIKRGLDTE